MKKMIMAIILLMFACSGVGAKEWTTPEALRAFGEPGDTVKESTNTPKPTASKKNRKSRKAHCNTSNKKVTSIHNDQPQPADVNPKPATNQPGTPTLQNELNSVYGKLYAAVRAGNFNEQMRYVTGDQQKSLEKVLNASDNDKALVKMMQSKMPKSYTTTGCSIASDGKSATLTTIRKTPVYNVNGEKISEQDTHGTINFIKVGNAWKVSLVNE
jgi:hypothetical protein